MPRFPLLFAIVADVLLRKLTFNFPVSLTMASADDTAVVVDSFFKHAKDIMELFKSYRKISGLAFNLLKTVLITLWPCDLVKLQACLSGNLSEWKG